MTDTELAQALRHEDALRRLAWMLHLGAADADDAVQHALTQVALGKRPPGMSLWAFLRTALRHHAWNVRKLARRRRTREAACARDEAQLPVDEMLARDQLRRRVADAVVALAEPYRTTVWLRWFEGFAVDDIAARTATPANTVRTRLQRAHAQLKLRLDRDYGGERWRALAVPLLAAAAAPLPLAPLAAAAATVATVLGAGAALTAALATDVPVPAAPAAIAAAAAHVEPAPRVPLDRFAMAPVTAPLPRAAATPARSSAALRVVHADGRLAAGLPVWWWHDDEERPDWTRRVDASTAVARGVADAADDPEPAPTTLRTGGEGRIAIPSPRPIAVTIAFGASSWFSADLPAGDTLELPHEQPCHVDVRKAPRGSAWSVALHVAPRDASASFARVRADVSTRTGPGVVRHHGVAITAGSDEPVRIRVPALDVRWQVVARGRGFVIDGEPSPMAAPFSLSLVAARRLARFHVSVRERDGTPTARGGTVRLRAGDEPPRFEALVRGRATFDVEAASGDASVQVWMADGEQAAAAARFGAHQWERGCEVRLSGRTDVQRVRVAGLPAVELHRVFVEDDANVWQRLPLAAAAERDTPPGYGVDGDVLWLAGLPIVAGRRVCFVATDGRTGLATLSWLGDATGEWQRANTPVTLDLAALYHEAGERHATGAVLELGLPTPSGEPAWTTLFAHEREPHGAAARRPQRWRDLQLPDTLPSRVRVLGPEATAAPLLEQALR
jgi:RNA polymerase sigma factor (sigma-70 family)